MRMHQNKMENYRSITKKPRLDNYESDSADEVQQDCNYSSRYYKGDHREHHRDDIKSPCRQKRDSINQTPDQKKYDLDISKSSSKSSRKSSSKSSRRHRSNGSKNRQDRQEHYRRSVSDSINQTPDQQKCESDISKTSSKRSKSDLEYNDSVHTEGIRNQRKRKRSPSPCDCSSSVSPCDERVSTSEYNFQKVVAEAKVPFVDSHCHLDLLFQRSYFNGNLRDFMKLKQDSFPKNYLGCVAVFCYPNTWRKLLNKESHMASILKEPNVWAAIGCHPKSAADFTSSTENDLKELLSNEKVKALGEIGLDYSGRFGSHHEIQKEVFARQVAIALDFNLPLVIHARDAESDICELLGKLVPKDYKIHRHCFTGNWMAAKAWLKKFPASYIGLTAAVTYPGNTSLREVGRRIPLDKLLLETDAPYFLPAQIPRSEKLSHPGMAIAVAAEVAAIRGIPLDDVLAACIRNTRAMYSL